MFMVVFGAGASYDSAPILRGGGAYDRAWFRNAVEEHLDEAGVESDIDMT